MKKHILSLTIVLAALTASAQNGIQSQSSFEDFTINYQVALSRPASDYANIITPMLCGSKDTLRLDPIIVEGKRYARKAHRTAKLKHLVESNHYTVKNMPDSEPRTLVVRTSTSQKWLLNEPVTLCVLTEREGCCKVETLSVACTDAVQYVAPKKPFKPFFADVEDNTGVAGALAKDNLVLEHISKYRPYDTSRILRKEKGMLYVHFPVNKTELRRDFRDNASILDKIVDITRQIMADTTSHVEKIQVIGLASVEGTQRHNIDLSKGRAEALKRYVQERVDTPDNLYECISGGEAWTELRDQINDTPSQYREQMLDIIDNEPNLDRREAKLRALDRGKAFTYLRDNILSDQRNSGYIRIYYDYVPDAAAATINKATALLRQEKYDEALQMLRTVQNDERAQNALGVALHMTGDEAAALRCFERAAANGNPEAKK
ncbi:MAG: hypothetical protein J5593_06765, partial [Bacteroidaceae bacterium]|nr:hypothetical protein [Bacteroidaceae bacterium]